MNYAFQALRKLSRARELAATFSKSNAPGEGKDIDALTAKTGESSESTESEGGDAMARFKGARRIPREEWSAQKFDFTGKVLVTHPMSCVTQPTLHQCVVILDEASEQHIRGFAVNIPQKQTLRRVLQRRYYEMFSPLLDNTTWNGGIVPSPVQILHEFPEIIESKVIMNGLCVSEINDHRDKEIIEEISEIIKDGRAEASAFKVVINNAGWAREQLKLELERNVWWLLSFDESEEVTQHFRNTSIGQLDQNQTSSKFLKNFKKDMWKDALVEMGEKYSELIPPSEVEKSEDFKKFIVEHFEQYGS